MAEFWPSNQSEPSSAKVVKPSGHVEIVAHGSDSRPDDPPTVLAPFRPVNDQPTPQSIVLRELSGEMLAQFRLDDYVGVGGMGAVFRATDVRLARSVALKILPPEQAKDPEIVARFQREACAAARLDHENIARVYCVGEDHGLHFIAFEFVEGVNVRDLIQQCGPIPAHEVVNYALQITGALMHAVTRRVVHRDIKPSNIIITEAGRAKLVDMGLARHFERRQDGGLTQSGVTLGTFDYIAPEQARDPRTADVRSDIYSLGCTLFHMLTGRPPYPDGTVLQKLLKHHEETTPDVRQMRPSVPRELAALVQRMMAKDPTRRFQSPEELLKELLEIAAGMGLKSTSPEGLIWVADPTPPVMSKSTWAVWLTAAAALFIVVFVIQWRPDRAAGQRAALEPAVVIPEGPVSVPATGSESRPAEPPEPEPVRAEPAQVDTERSNGAEPENAAARPAPVPDTPQADPEIIVIGPDHDLRAAIERAPSGSIIEVHGTHRPQLMHLVDDTAGIRIEGKRLTIKAAPGGRPRIVLSYDDRDFAVTDWTLFTLSGAQLEVEGIQFELGVDPGRAPWMSVFALHSSHLVLRRATFLQTQSGSTTGGRRESDPTSWVAHLDSGIALAGDTVASRVSANECFFGGGDGGFFLDGPAKVDLVDCTLLPYRSSFLIKSMGFPQELAAELRFMNVSVFCGGPVFDLHFSRAVVHSQNVVFSCDAAGSGVLARVDGDSRLDWKARHNLYHGVRQFLVSRNGSEPVPLATRLDDWKQLSTDLEDRESIETSRSPWLISLADAARKRHDDPHVADAFRIQYDESDASWRPIGARFVLPWGALYNLALSDAIGPFPVRSPGAALADGAASPERARGDAATTPAASNDTASRAESAPSPIRTADSTGSATSAKLDMKKIMSQMPPAGDSNAASSAPAADRRPTPDVPAAATTRDTLVVEPTNPNALRSIADACARAEDGAVIEIRHQGRLRERPMELGDRHLTIRAAPGYRPIVELVSGSLDLRGREPRLFDIGHGSLTLRDLDLQLVADPTIGAEHWSLITSRTADITLDGCTVTVEADIATSTALVRLLTSNGDDPMHASPDTVSLNRPRLQLRNSMVLGISCLLRSQPAGRLRLEVENCAIATQEHLLTVLGGSDHPAFGTSTELELLRSTIRTKRGLVSFEAVEPRAWLPRLEISATDNILVNELASSWIRFKSPRPADELRGLLGWKGSNNCYDGGDVFWEIESMTTGERELYSWEEWLKSPARSEIKAERVAVEFTDELDAARPWLATRAHFQPHPARSASESAASGTARGADLSQIPPPPHEREAP